MSGEPNPTIDTRTFWQKARAVLFSAPVLRALLAFASAAGGAAAVQLGCEPKTVERVQEIIVEVPVPQGGPPGAGPGAMGWESDPEAVEAIAKTLPIQGFKSTPAGQVGDVPDHVYLWDAAKKVLGRHVPTRNQLSVGSCVSFGCACAIEYLQCVQIASGKRDEFKDIAQEVIYGGSRVQIGGGRIRGDGSLGVWGAQWCNQYGAVARGKYGNIDLGRYDEAQCRRFGDRGCPTELVPLAKERPVKSIALVKTVDEARKALASGYPVTVASNVGFGMRGPYVRNAKGQLRASGSWPHQMCLIGYDKDAGFYCMNSWGESWVSGPTGPGNPPPGGFYIEDATVARILAEGDSWAFGDLTGFPKRALDWNVRAVPAPARDACFAVKLFRPEYALAP